MLVDGNFREDSERGLLNEESPLLIRHMSMEKPEKTRQRPHSRYTSPSSSSTTKTGLHLPLPRHRLLVLLLLVFVLLFLVGVALLLNTLQTAKVISIKHANIQYVQVDSDVYLWVRTWGNRQSGIPVLFVHGGPGNAIADYGNSNAEFFDCNEYFVVEVDQRGTGQSKPSVRDSADNMKLYENISVDRIAADYEIVRKELQLDQWLVFGGSFGSTVGIYYSSHYPQSSLGLIVRGIYLDTPEEMQAVYARSSHLNHPSRVQAFDILYGYAASKANEWIDPNDAQALTLAYFQMIRQGDQQAIWHWHVYENNLMETEPSNLLDPQIIDWSVFPEAQSVAFFETRLWLRGAYEHPLNLLDSVHHLRQVNFIRICQGRHDLVCPARYTRLLTDALDDAHAYYGVRYLNSGHEQSDPIMALCLKESLQSFQTEYSLATGWK